VHDVEIVGNLGHTRAPLCRTRGDRQKLLGKPRLKPGDRRQEVVTNAVAQMESREVGRIVDVRHVVTRRVAGDRIAPQSQEWPNHLGFGEQRCKSARPRLAQDANEDRLDLIVERVRGGDRSAELGSRSAKEVPAGDAPFVLGCGPLRGLAGDELEMKLGGATFVTARIGADGRPVWERTERYA